jgi:hypothetical protein
MSFLNVNQVNTAGNLPSFTTGANTITFNGSTNVIGASSASTMKNRLINGAMAIDQRHSGASVTPSTASTTYIVDRFAFQCSLGSKITAGQNLNAVTPPTGFNYYLGHQTASAYSIGAGDYFFSWQVVENFNWMDLAWGTANPQSVTLSFWVYSSLTGTFGGSLQNYTDTRSYPFTYSIPSANTWTKISITIPGDTNTAWSTIASGNAGSAQLNFGMGLGSTYSNTAGAWASGNYISATGATSVVGTANATFYITGVQLEVGSTATSFDYRPYGTELQLCQRYFVQIQKYTTFASASYFSSTRADGFMPLPVPMRTTPSFVVATGANYYRVYLAGVSSNCSTVGFNGTNYQNSIALIYNNSDFSGLANGAGWWDSPNSSSSIGVTAEL